MFSVSRYHFSGNGPGQLFLEKVVNYTQIHEILCLLEPVSGWCLYETHLSLRWNFNEMLLQTSMNTSKKWSAEIVEILKAVSYEPAYQWIKGKNKGIHRHVSIFLLLKKDKRFQPVSHSVRLVCLCSTHNIWDSGKSGWKRYSHVILGNQLRSIFCFMVIIENPASHT